MKFAFWAVAGGSLGIGGYRDGSRRRLLKLVSDKPV